MATKRVLMTFNSKFYSLLEKKADANCMTVQEAVHDILRRNMDVPHEQMKKSHAGRPPKVDDKYLEYFSRKR